MDSSRGRTWRDSGALPAAGSWWCAASRLDARAVGQRVGLRGVEAVADVGHAAGRHGEAAVASAAGQPPDSGPGAGRDRGHRDDSAWPPGR